MPIATTEQYAAMLDAAAAGGYAFPGVNRTIELALPSTAWVERGGGGAAQAVNILPLSALKRGLQVKLWTQPAPSTLEAQMGQDGALVANRVQLL